MRDLNQQIFSFDGEDYCSYCMPRVANMDELRPSIDGVCSFCGAHNNKPEADEYSAADPLNFDDEIVDEEETFYFEVEEEEDEN